MERRYLSLRVCEHPTLVTRPSAYPGSPLVSAFILFFIGFVGPSPALSQSWNIDPDPVVSVGGHSEDPRYILTEVVGGLRLDDGRIIVADRFTNGLRVYSADGAFLKDIGRAGEGPGEYEYIRGVDRCAGFPVVAFDLHWDMKLYDAQLELAEERSALLPGIGSTPYKFDCSPSGHWIATGWGRPEDQFQEGFFQATAPVVLGMDSEVLKPFGERLSSERIGTVRDDGSAGGTGPHPFGRQTNVAIGMDRVYLGDASDYRIEVYDLHGNPLAPLEWTGPDREITNADLERYGEELMRGVTADRAPSYRRWLRAIPSVEEFPAYDALRVDQEGHLWVRYFRRPGDTYSRWVIFNGRGQRVGSLRLTARTSVLDSGSDFLLVVERDELDVATVVLYHLVRSQDPAGGDGLTGNPVSSYGQRR